AAGKVLWRSLRYRSRPARRQRHDRRRAQRTSEARPVTAPAQGRLTRVGTAPGDPDVLTLTAVRALAEADVVAHFAKRNANGNARAIVHGHMRPGIVELPLHYPVTTEIDKDHDDYKTQILAFYEQSAAAVAAHLDAGRTVAVLSEGDPLF